MTKKTKKPKPKPKLIVLSAPGVEPVVQLDPFKVVRERMFVASNSGGGKSHALRLFVEQAATQLPVIIIDPEGEWPSIRTHVPALLVGSVARGADAPADHRIAGELALLLVQENCSAVLDLSDLERADQAKFVRCFIEGLFKSPDEHRSPRLIIIDEAHRFAPEGAGAGEAESRAAVIRLVDSGRKFGFGAVLASQRFAKVAKSVLAELNVLLLGRFAHVIDRKLAAEAADIEQRHCGQFSKFMVGEFMALGPAFTHEGTIRFRTNPTTVTVAPQPGSWGATTPPARSGQLVKVVDKLSGLHVGEGEGEGEPEQKTSQLVVELRASLARTERERQRLQDVLDSFAGKLREHIDGLQQIIPDQQPSSPSPRKPDPEPVSSSPTPRKAKPDPEPAHKGKRDSPDPKRVSSGMSVSSRRFLTALAMFPKGLTIGRLRTVTGLATRGGSYNTTMKELRSNGWIEGGGAQLCQITPDGLLALGDDVAEIPPPGHARVAFWRTKLKSTSAKTIMDVFVAAYTTNKGATLTAADIGARTNLATRGGSYNTAMRQLKDYDIIRGARDMCLNPDIMELGEDA